LLPQLWQANISPPPLAAICSHSVRCDSRKSMFMIRKRAICRIPKSRFQRL
jgi:hypothetical protein